MYENETLYQSGHLEKYAVCMLTLQEKANLSYKEARAVLYPFRGETIWELAEIYGVSVNAVLNQRRRGLEKMKSSDIDLDDLIRDNPMDVLMVNPILKKH